MNLYEKIQVIKSELNKLNLKKSGENNFANFKYYELADFLPQIVELCRENKVLTFVSFSNEEAILTAINSEKPDESLVISSPMRELELKGCNAIQALGGIETYQRRYLYMAMFDIVENDMFDGGNTDPDEKPSKAKKTPLQTARDALVVEMNNKLKQGMTKAEVEEKLKLFDSEKPYTKYNEQECVAAVEFLKAI